MEENMMLKQNFADQLKAQSEIWKAQVKDYQGRVEQAGEQARGEYKKSMEQMKTRPRKQGTLPRKSVVPTRRHGRTWSGQARRLLSNFRGAGPTQFRVSSETINGGIGRRRSQTRDWSRSTSAWAVVDLLG